MTNNIPDHRALRDWAVRQPRPIRDAAITVHFTLQNIQRGLSSPWDTQRLAECVAKMQGGE